MCIRDSTIRAAEKAGGTTVRLHTGDPCLYGALREQMDALDANGIPYDDTPGVSSSVSYTHLDVYKRQHQGRCRFPERLSISL